MWIKKILNFVEEKIVDSWYSQGYLVRLFLPLSFIYQYVCMLINKRNQRKYINKKIFFPNIPIIVVGNISVGGTGKTPVVACLAKSFTKLGYKVGIASHGYKSSVREIPRVVKSNDLVNDVGDEALVLARQLGIPIVICKNYNSSIRLLIEQSQCDLIITDDGLQHDALRRDIEIAVVDGQRMFGNGYCLPAGPLREPVDRLKSVDYIFFNGQPSSYFFHSQQSIFTTKAKNILPINSKIKKDIPSFLVHGVAAIGNPSRFFSTLSSLGFEVIPHVFPDHYQYVITDLQFGDNLPIIMTEKDAVKCRHLNLKNLWYIEIEAVIDVSVINSIHKSII